MADEQSWLITGVILCGGKGSRLGGQDKGLIEVAGRPLARHVADTLRPHVQSLIIIANRNLDDYKRICPQVYADDSGPYHGPLAGIASALAQVTTPYALICACDMPRLPAQLIARLWSGMQRIDADAACVRDPTGLQPFPLLMKTKLLDSARQSLATQHYKLGDWLLAQQPAIIDIPETLTNINAPQDL
ncbi:MAG: molybdenum cofactor guanylyltransferase [Gammaproteobacteria bacterium]|nr:molybdenum cofactor guanylyltransferase [Gammaproteobacteria bacterium]